MGLTSDFEGTSPATPRGAVVVGAVVEIQRFPVKSMRGERLDQVQVGPSAVERDRVWALRSVDVDEITSAKRIPGLLRCSARFLDDALDVQITLPSGEVTRSSDGDVSKRLSDELGQPVLLQPLAPAEDKQHYRLRKLRSPAEVRRLLGISKGGPPPDMSEMPIALLGELALYATPRGTYFDAFPIHFVTTNALEALSNATGLPVTSDRFRPNFVIQVSGVGPGYPEWEWSGRRLIVGEAEFQLRAATFRCGMVAHAQSDQLPKAPALIRAVYDQLGSKFGVYASVVRAGRVAVGDQVLLCDAPSALSSGLRQIGNSIKAKILRTYWGA